MLGWGGGSFLRFDTSLGVGRRQSFGGLREGSCPGDSAHIEKKVGCLVIGFRGIEWFRTEHCRDWAVCAGFEMMAYEHWGKLLKGVG